MSWLDTWKRRRSRLSVRGGSAPVLRSFLRRQFSKAKLMRNLALGSLVAVVVGALFSVLLFAIIAKDLPQPDKIVRREGFATKIMDRNSELLYEVFADEQRTPITIDQVPGYLKQATLAIEDKNFYTHGGFDTQGYLRIIWNVITRGRLIGGSTLTQQLVKNVLLTNQRSVVRKLKEFILAVQIEGKYNKDEILQMYLNEAPYGGTAWGVATAANTYFGKEVKDLTLLESAILAGLPQSPSRYSPYSSTPTAYKTRAKEVLRRMREDGYITAELEKQTLTELEVLEIKPQLTSIKAPHFVLYVKQQLEEMYGEDLVEQGGLQVTTTLDYELQQKAQTAVTEEIAKVAAQGIGNGAAMMMDPNTGEIISMVGSKDFFAKDYDGQVNVTQSLRQPGSAIKPVTYVTAFKKGYTPAHVLMDVPTEFPGGDGKAYKPVNYDGKFRGPVQLRFALGSSLNVPAVKLLALVGVDDMMQTAFDMGFSTLEPTAANKSRFGLAVTLGGGEVRLQDLTTAYSAFANGGLRVEPVSILRVADRNGKTLFEHKQVPGKRVLTEAEAFLINHVLSDNNARLLTFGPNSYLNMNGRAVAVKTGTTNDKRDNWTIGWSRNSMVGVWVGNNDNSAMKNVASGVTGASPIWRQIMLAAITKYQAPDWVVPSNVDAVQVDTVSGYPAHDGFAERTEYVIHGTLPTAADPIHTKLRLCRAEKKLASELDISRGDYDEKEFYVIKEDFALSGAPSWQQAINDWVNGQGDEKYHPPSEYCSSQDTVAVQMDSPTDHQNFSDKKIPFRIRVLTNGDVKGVDIYVDGSKKETLVDRPYNTDIEMDANRHTVRAVATRADGKQGDTGDIHIGVGGVPWEEPTPAPSPVVSPSPTP